MKISDIFEINQGHQITDEEIYRCMGSIPIITGNNEVKGYWNKSIITEKMLPCLTYPTKAFSGCISIQENIFDANNTAVLIYKKGMDNVVKIEYMKYILRNKFLSLMTSKENISYLNREIVENIEIDIPEIKIQEKIIKKYQIVENFNNKISSYYSLLEAIYRNKTLLIKYNDYQAYEEPIKNILDYMGGNSGLTEEFIYQNLQNSGSKYKVLSSSIKDDYLGYIHEAEINGKSIKVLENKDSILINRKGKAGYTQFVNAGKNTINDNVYLLYVKDSCKFQINLRWLMIAYKKDFLEYSSNCDNGTWNMTGFFENVKIDIPSIEEQDTVADKWVKLKNLKDCLSEIRVKLQELIGKEIIF